MRLITQEQKQVAYQLIEDSAPPDHLAAIERILTHFYPIDQSLQSLPLVDFFSRSENLFSFCLLSLLGSLLTASDLGLTP